MSIKRLTFLCFCWYFLVSTKIIPLAITPVIDAAANGMLTGKPMNVTNVATLGIPVAMLIPLEQAFNHTNRFNILLYFLCFFLNVCSLAFNPLLMLMPGPRSDDSQPKDSQALAPRWRSPAQQYSEVTEEVDTYYSSPFLINEQENDRR